MMSSITIKSHKVDSPYHDVPRAQQFAQYDVIREIHGYKAVVASFFGPLAQARAQVFAGELRYAEKETQ